MKIRDTFNKYVSDGSLRKTLNTLGTGLSIVRDKTLQGAGFIVGLSEVGLESGSSITKKVSEEANKGRAIAKALANSSSKRGASYKEEPPHPVFKAATGQSDMFEDCPDHPAKEHHIL